MVLTRTGPLLPLPSPALHLCFMPWMWPLRRTGMILMTSSATMPGLLKVLETFVVGVIFAFFSSPSLYLHPVVPHTPWCGVSVYSICFILGAVVLLLKLSERECRLCAPYPIFQLVLTLFSILLHISTVILWPLCQFNGGSGGSPSGPVLRAAVMNSPKTCASGIAYWLWPP